jgi:hypothetical protein
MPLDTPPDLAPEFLETGFCIVPNVLGPALLDDFRALAARRLSETDADHFERYSHHGSLVPLKVDYEPVAAVLTSPELHTAFQRLGFTDPRWISGYVISKPPRSPGLWWHQDWWGWGHPSSYAPEPTQIFCMIYLEPTTRENGCLRAIPRTHLERHYLHDALPVPHTLEIENKDDADISHGAFEDEMDIVAQPGDLVIGDVRVLHATHPNRSYAPRTAIDLLFLPHYDSLPNEFKTHYVNQYCLPPRGWWRDPTHPLVGTALGRMLPTFDGPDVEPVEFTRKPVWPSDADKPVAA